MCSLANILIYALRKGVIYAHVKAHAIGLQSIKLQVGIGFYEVIVGAYLNRAVGSVGHSNFNRISSYIQLQVAWKSNHFSRYQAFLGVVFERLEVRYRKKRAH